MSDTSDIVSSKEWLGVLSVVLVVSEVAVSFFNKFKCHKIIYILNQYENT